MNREFELFLQIEIDYRRSIEIFQTDYRGKNSHRIQTSNIRII